MPNRMIETQNSKTYCSGVALSDREGREGFCIVLLLHSYVGQASHVVVLETRTIKVRLNTEFAEVGGETEIRMRIEVLVEFVVPPGS